MVALTKTVGHKRGRPNEEGGRGTRINAVLINSKAYNREKTMRGRVGMRNLRALIEVRRGARHVSTKAYFQTAEGALIGVYTQPYIRTHKKKKHDSVQSTCSDYCWASLEAAAEKKTCKNNKIIAGWIKGNAVQFARGKQGNRNQKAPEEKWAQQSGGNRGQSEVLCNSRTPTNGVAVWRRQRRSKRKGKTRFRANHALRPVELRSGGGSGEASPSRG